MKQKAWRYVDALRAIYEALDIPVPANTGAVKLMPHYSVALAAIDRLKRGSPQKNLDRELLVAVSGLVSALSVQVYELHAELVPDSSPGVPIEDLKETINMITEIVQELEGP